MAESNEARVWGIHSKDEKLFLNERKIAIGCGGEKLGDLSKIEATRDAFKKHYSEVFIDAKKDTIASYAGTLYRFIYEVQIGDYVIFSKDRMVHIGIVQGQCFYDESAIYKPQKYVYQRNVEWIKHLQRIAFSQGALYEIDARGILFRVTNYANEYLAALNKDFVNSVDEDEHVDDPSDEMVELSTKDFILKELSKNLKGYDFEDFIANLLKAMGYRATVSAHGGDSGIDITAYKDELPPRILVQVKSQDGDIKESTIQSLKGAMREGDYGLFVTLSNYTKNAQKYLDATPIIRGINGDELADLILKYYDGLSDKYKNIIPLKKSYIPCSKEDRD